MLKQLSTALVILCICQSANAQIEIDRSMTVAVEKIAARDLAPPDVRIPRSEPTPSLGFVWDLAGVASVAAAAGFAVAYLLPHAMAGAPWAAAATVLCAGACLVTLAEPGQAEPPSPSA